MGSASALNAHLTVGLQWAPISGAGDRLLLGLRPTLLSPPLGSRSRSISTLTLARRQNRNPVITSSPKNNKKRLSKNEDEGEDEDEDEDGDEEDMVDFDEDALEALFNQLEEDLKKADPNLMNEEDFKDLSEEDLKKLDQELAEMDEQISQVFDMTGFEDDDDEDDEILKEIDDEEDAEENDDDDDDEEEEEEEQPLQLRNWQLRRLAMALKTGRRKTNIKILAAELCLDRSIVLELLRNPPPKLLMLSASLPDNEPSSPIITINKADTTVETIEETIPEPEPTPKPNTAVKVPVHVMQNRYASQKRIKKADIQTMENVYRRSKRPTNAMIKSIVEVTNLPRKRVVKWFEDKRTEEGVPEQRVAYQRSGTDTDQ